MSELHPLLTTERLTLRRFTPADLDLFARLNADPEVMLYMGGIKTRAQSEAVFQARILDYYEANAGMGVWATIERATGECVGLHLLNNIQGETHLQVGYQLFRKHWGTGYATEMARAVVRYGFTVLGLPRLVGITDQPNVASQKVLLKAGLRRNGERAFPHPAYVKSGPLAWFERDAESWRAEFGTTHP